MLPMFCQFIQNVDMLAVILVSPLELLAALLAVLLEKWIAVHRNANLSLPILVHLHRAALGIKGSLPP